MLSSPDHVKVLKSSICIQFQSSNDVIFYNLDNLTEIRNITSKSRLCDIDSSFYSIDSDRNVEVYDEFRSKCGEFFGSSALSSSFVRFNNQLLMVSKNCENILNVSISE